MKYSALTFCLWTAIALAGCGQRGPLYLPGHPPPGLKVADEDKAPASEQDKEDSPAQPETTQIDDIAPTTDSSY